MSLMEEEVQFRGRHIFNLRQEIQEKQKYLAEQKEELAEKRNQVMNLTIQVDAVEAHLEMLQGLLVDVSTAVFDEDKVGFSDEDVDLSPQKESRTPMEMLKPQFKGMQLGDIVEILLEYEQRPLTVSEIGRKIYDAKDKKEFARARNSLSAELRTGATKKPPRWIKQGRSAYVPLSLQSGSKADMRTSTRTVKGGDDMQAS